MEKREPLDNLTDRLMLDCLLKETVQGRVLQTFSESIRAAFSLDIFTKDAEQTLDTVPEIDDRSIIACLSDEPEFFNAGLDFATVPFDEIRIQSDTIQAGDVDETIADHSAIAVLRVPSHISLPLHRALLSVVHIMVRLLVHTIPKPESCRTFCLTLCDAFLSEFSSIADQYLSLLHSETLEPNVDTNSGIPDVPNGVIPPRALQLMFDTQFLIKLLISSSRPGQNNVRSDISGSQQNCQLEKEVRAKAKLLLSTFESLIDPFDLEVSTPRLSSAVSVAFNGLAHLYAPLIWPGTNAQIISNEATDATVDTATAESKSAASMFMPLLTGRNRPSFTTLPLSWSTCFDKRRSKTSCSGRTKGTILKPG
ncbi:hypothetical protein D915_009371 [Fasciola hepatica]|uniref:Conserved oligomeric Golgi complex subunit 1 n=1 Tax=Fasciola hepatica TaxID=6192 RepID=A0A4E0R325_FASHE|nr:hypothetical protein D915_009371 [Fasciola hepatica]